MQIKRNKIPTFSLIPVRCGFHGEWPRRLKSYSFFVVVYFLMPAASAKVLFGKRRTPKESVLRPSYHLNFHQAFPGLAISFSLPM